MIHIRFILLTCLALVPSLVVAADLSGTVRDHSGAAVPQATVSVLTPRQAVVATVVTDGAGAFHIRDLAPGDYVVRVAAAGFGEQQTTVSVRTVAASVAVVLDVAAVREQVTVTSSPGFAQDAARSLQPVSVISREQLDQRVTTVVAQAVSEEAGVHLQIGRAHV